MSFNGNDSKDLNVFQSANEIKDEFDNIIAQTDFDF